MKRQIILLIFLLSGLQFGFLQNDNIIIGCSSVKETGKPVFQHLNNHQKFRLESNSILLKSKVNDAEEELLFDTGYSSTLLH
jgi:hypothetical protein